MLYRIKTGQECADGHLPVYGEGLNVRDWLHVEDHCKIIARYLENRRWWVEIISGKYRNYYEKMYSNRREQVCAEN